MLTLTNEQVRDIVEGYPAPEGFDCESLLAWIESAPGTDEDYQAGCDGMSAAMGLYSYCIDYHGGQGSMEYRVMCQLTRPGLFSPGLAAGSLSCAEDEDAINVYRALGREHDCASCEGD